MVRWFTPHLFSWYCDCSVLEYFHLFLPAIASFSYFMGSHGPTILRIEALLRIITWIPLNIYGKVDIDPTRNLSELRSGLLRVWVQIIQTVIASWHQLMLLGQCYKSNVLWSCQLQWTIVMCTIYCVPHSLLFRLL